MRKDPSDNFNGITDTAKEYIKARFDLIKLTVLGKSTQITTLIVGGLISVFVILMAIFFAFAAFVVWYGQTYNDYLTGLLIVVVSLVVLAILFFLLKKPLLTSIILRKYSDKLFDENEEIK
jgi:cytochrome c biogenesis protein CcdA